MCASLWPDPADTRCPQSFRDATAEALIEFAATVRSDKHLAALCLGHWARWNRTDARSLPADSATGWLEMRSGLLDFISDYSNWNATKHASFEETAKKVTIAAHNSLAQASGNPRFAVLDPFAGGGAIPLEAMRLGAEATASDLNPVATLLQKILLDFVPRHGDHLRETVARLSGEVKARAVDALAKYYPEEAGGAVPIAYLWARTVRCEGPGCGAVIPLIRSGLLAKKGKDSVFLAMDTQSSTREVSFRVERGSPEGRVAKGTIRNGHATCPLCDFTTRNERVRDQLSKRQGGSIDARLLALVVVRRGERGRQFLLPSKLTLEAFEASRRELLRLRKGDVGRATSFVPDEAVPLARPSPNARGLSPVGKMGFREFGDFFSPRQALAVGTFAQIVHDLAKDPANTPELLLASVASLAAAVDRLAEHATTLCRWNASGQKMQATFGRQAVPIVWDYCEANPFGGSVGSWDSMVDCVLQSFEAIPNGAVPANVTRSSALTLGLPDDSADLLFTDPPYYDAVPYGDLSEFFYVWLRRSVGHHFESWFGTREIDKNEEAIWNPSRIYRPTGQPKDREFYERQMRLALEEARRVVSPSGLAVVVFAHTSTEGWEALLNGLVGAGWIVTASWPIDTEMGTRMNAMGTASLASSVHLVCRPRERIEGSRPEDEVGSWRDVLAELPARIHEWMPRLAREGVVGADAIFACLGPALEIFSRYSRVEKASGDPVALREYLEQVWAAVAREALSLIFEGADATGLEEDARLTAMWLWTLGAGATGMNSSEAHADDDADSSDDDDDGSKAKPAAGFVLEFDAARKISQGLGAHLEKLTSVVEVKGDKARLLAVAERAKFLFRKQAGSAGTEPSKEKARAKPSKKQLGLFAEIEAAEKEGLLGDTGVPSAGDTTLDRVHQAMILFAAGRSEAVKRFVVDEGVGNDARFWKLAQSLSALYPGGSDEKRWVDGVLARKKSLGF